MTLGCLRQPSHQHIPLMLLLFPSGRQCGLHSLLLGCGDTVRKRQWFTGQKKGEITSSPPLPRPSCSSVQYLGHTTEEVQEREMVTAAWSSTQPVLSWKAWSSPFRIFIISPVADKALHRDSLFQSITLHLIKLTGFYCLSACRGFPALCNNHYSKENYLPNMEKKFYSPLQSAETQQTL